MYGARLPCQVTVHYRRFRTDSVPCDHDALLRWLYDRWAEKDRLLDHFYRTGTFPASATDPPAARMLTWSDSRCILINSFLAVSAWFAIRIIFTVSGFLLGLVIGWLGIARAAEINGNVWYDNFVSEGLFITSTLFVYLVGQSWVKWQYLYALKVTVIFNLWDADHVTSSKKVTVVFCYISFIQSKKPLYTSIFQGV